MESGSIFQSLLALLLVSCGGSGGTTTTISIQVVAVAPENGSGGIARDTTLSVRFAEPLDPSSVTADALVANDGHGDVRGTLRYDPAALTLSCVPERLLARDTVVVATLSPRLRTAQQRELGSALTWSFTTRAATWSAESVLGEGTTSSRLSASMNADGAAAVAHDDVVHQASATGGWGPPWQLPNPPGTPTIHGVKVLAEGSVLIGWSATEGTRRRTRLTGLETSGSWSTSTVSDVEDARWRGTTFYTSTSGHVLARVAIDQYPLPWTNLAGAWSAAGPVSGRQWLPTSLLWYWRAGPDIVRIDDIGGFARYSGGAFNTPAMLGYFDLRAGLESYAAPAGGTIDVFLADDGTLEVLEIVTPGVSSTFSVRGERFNQALYARVLSGFAIPQGLRSWLVASAANGDLAIVVDIAVDDGHSRLVGLGFDAERRTWTDPQELSAAEPWLPAPRTFALAMGARGDGWLVFARQGAPGSGDPLVGFRYRAKRGFGPAQTLATLGAATGIRTHTVAVDAEGRAVVTWLDFVSPPIATPKIRAIRSD